MSVGQLYMGGYAVGSPCTFTPDPIVKQWNAVACFTHGHPFDCDENGLVKDYGGLGGAFCHVHGFVPGASVVRARQESGRYPRRRFGQEYPSMFAESDKPSTSEASGA